MGYDLLNPTILSCLIAQNDLIVKLAEDLSFFQELDSDVKSNVVTETSDLARTEYANPFSPLLDSQLDRLQVWLWVNYKQVF